MTSRNEGRAGTALAICFISMGFLLETVVADHRHPNPLSPLVLSLLSTAAIGSFLAWAWFSRAAKRDQP